MTYETPSSCFGQDGEYLFQRRLAGNNKLTYIGSEVHLKCTAERLSTPRNVIPGIYLMLNIFAFNAHNTIPDPAILHGRICLYAATEIRQKPLRRTPGKN